MNTHTSSSPAHSADPPPSPPPRKSMEDADSSVTRKRPRLDSGERTYRSMSADPGFTTTSYPVQTSQPPAGTTPELEVSSKEQLDTTPLDNPQLGTPSKVTINVRDYGTSTSPIQTHTTLVKKAKRVESPPSPSPIQPMSAGKPKPSQTSSSTTSSSASGSPHIEIGEPEDMDDKPQAEMWLDSNAVPPEDPRQMADQLMATFPEIRNFRSFRDLLQKMGLFLAQQDLGDGTLINRLGGWMEDYVRCTSNYPHLWRKFCIDYIECFERIPQLINCLLGRTEPFDAKFVQIPEGNVTLDNRNFFKVLSLGFTSLTLRMLQIDATELEDSQGDSTTTPRLLSPRYIIALGHLCNPAESHLWKLLFHTYKYNIYDPVTSVHSRLISRDGLRLVTGIITALLNRTTSSTELQLHAVSMLTAATQFCLEGTPAPSVPPKLLPTDSSISQEFLSLFEAVNAQLQISIRKQSSSLSFENLNPLVNDLEFVLLRITSRDHELCKKILDNTVGLEYGESSERLPELATIVWKSQLLKLCITKGRMEARLFGVETLAQNLISVWEQRIKDRSSWTADVVVQYLADFILRSKIIDYLVGVESHPQLLTRGKNVLGFLAVTDRYSNDQTDLIWNAVITSQDPRTVDAILESLLKGIFDLIHYSHILYWVEKLQSLPYTRYEGQMLHFCRELLAALIKKYETKADDLDRMAVAPYLLLVQMLQTASADDSLKDSRARSTWVLASEMLSKFLRRGPDSTHRLKIFTTCLGHLSSASPGTSGNIATINALLNVDDFSTYEASMGDYSSFVGVMTAEFERFASARAGTANSDPTYEPLLLIRLELLFKTLVRVPDSFTDKQTESLWISTVGHLAMNGNARQLAWHTLQRVAKACPNGNVFLDKCLNKHFFVLKPDYFTESALIFAESTVDYATPEQPNGNLLADSLLWHISITVTSEAIGESAIESLIKVYLNLGAEETIGADSYHDKLVERCIQELSDAASIMEAAKIGSETNAGTDMPSTDDLAAQKRRFSRNLSLLKAYLQAVRAKFPAIQPRDISESPQSVHGDQIRLAYQPYDGGKSFGIKHIEIGNLATLGDLIARLKKLTTFSSFRVISGGQNLDILKFNDTLLRDLSLEKKGLILLQKVPGAPPYGDRPVPVRLQPLEAEVMQNFEKLYDLLEIDVDLGHEIYNFLLAFPPAPSILSLICDSDSLYETRFPLQAPHKLLYSVFAQKFALQQHLAEGVSDHNLLERGVNALCHTLVFLEVGATDVFQQQIAKSVVESLLMFLKEPVDTNFSSKYFKDGQKVLEQLGLFITAAASSSQDTTQGSELAKMCFLSMLEMCVLDSDSWIFFKELMVETSLLKLLLLETDHEQIRQDAVVAILSVCKALPDYSQTTSKEFISFFWKYIVELIPQTANVSHNVRQFYEVGLAVFRLIDETEQLNLMIYLKDWSVFMLQLDHTEFVGRFIVNDLLFGVAGLIDWCIQLLRSRKQPMGSYETLMTSIFLKFLFPPAFDMEETQEAEIKSPILHSETRALLYSIVLGLGSEPASQMRLIALTRDLLSEGEDLNTWSWGIAQTSKDYAYEPNQAIERYKLIRSPTGYAGMRNLSNTCYLNSLFTQLFMNPNFRECILNADVTDPEDKQKLLHEIQKLFAAMQETWLKAVDPMSVSEAVITYEGTPIDVSLQMDVDEFYNLLFDRLENQIATPQGKQQFRNFYGGQLVQQIKSKDCPHVSERLEPFSAIQCEIKGKSSLDESLKAYIEGEVMEGDNKYSCSSCGAYVNAVKRACLKDIPDNLIFHLKRFDYDVVTGMRSKINDHFEFPMEIDMTPYDVKYLKDTTQNLPPDKFNLVGVLIHTGNAEAGHYYSYIKERNGKPHSWVEFNDADVTTFDLGTLQESSFGGLGEPNFGVRYTRAWNAYMLFYERATVSAANGGQLGQSVDQPVHVTMPRELFLPVAQNNKEFIRKFCMFDPEHSKYVRLLLDQYRLSSKGECSDDHRLEKRVIQCALMQVEQVLSRMKDCADLDYAVLFLSKMTLKCSTCCYIFLEVLANTGQIFRNLLLRNVSEDFRRKVVKLVSGALYYLRCADTRAYGFDVDDLDQCSADDVVGQMSGALQLVLKSLKEMHTFVYSHQSRSCQEYFDLLVAISRFGLPDAWLIHNYGFLACCLETLVVEEVDPHLRKLKAQSPYIAYLRRVDKGNSPPLQSLVVLTALILDHMDFERELDVANADLEHFVMRRALTRHEQSLLAFNTEIRDRGNHVANVVFLCKALEQDRENSEAAQHIVRILIQNMPRTHELYWNIFSTICTGVNIEPAWQAKPFLDAALVFMQHCEASEDGVKMIDRIATEVSTIGDYGGMEHLEFLKKASDIRNTNFVDREDYAAYLRAVRRSLPVWAIHLLTYHEYDVRVKTKQFLLDMFQINEEVTINADEAQEIKGVAIAMVNACNRWFRMTTRTCSQIEVARILELEQVFLFCLQEFVEPDSPLQNEELLEQLRIIAVEEADDALSNELESDDNLTEWSNSNDVP